VIDIDDIEREGGAGKARDPFSSEELIAGQTLGKRRGSFVGAYLDAEQIPCGPGGLN
jgi:hypothetical protein